ncbi:hypothetical protein A7982_13054 [Minicystis rosea]|nr:hypothetical protein A7982_13054 [Minicystis rosea]
MMPGLLLSAGSKVLCAHGAQAMPAAPVPRVTVMGQPVVTKVAPHAVAGCPNPPAPAGTGPCVMAQWLTAATRVTVMGQPVLLADSKALCTPTGAPASVIPVQSRVQGI